MYSEIKPYIKGGILEVGSGIGTFSRKIINDFQDHKVFLSDIDPEYIKNLENTYSPNENIQAIKLDLGKSSDFENINDKISTVIALNVLEHVKNDIDALNNIYNLLAPGGKLILLVPAHKFLFNCIDASLDHFRRYAKKELLYKISHTEFRIKKIFYFNLPAIFGWYINGNIMKKNISEGSVSLFDKLVPFFKFFERYILRKKMGISLIAILEK
ncbi:MAG: class I SAM-dependent methyltransferase [Patescibacteria group bacterium]|nr:class I SAM-dependent methyltransferase [Patescibacteria group bacterium]